MGGFTLGLAGHSQKMLVRPPNFYTWHDDEGNIYLQKFTSTEPAMDFRNFNACQIQNIDHAVKPKFH